MLYYIISKQFYFQFHFLFISKQFHFRSDMLCEIYEMWKNLINVDHKISRILVDKKL